MNSLSSKFGLGLLALGAAGCADNLSAEDGCVLPEIVEVAGGAASCVAGVMAQDQMSHTEFQDVHGNIFPPAGSVTSCAKMDDLLGYAECVGPRVMYDNATFQLLMDRNREEAYRRGISGNGSFDTRVYYDGVSLCAGDIYRPTNVDTILVSASDPNTVLANAQKSCGPLKTGPNTNCVGPAALDQENVPADLRCTVDMFGAFVSAFPDKNANPSQVASECFDFAEVLRVLKCFDDPITPSNNSPRALAHAQIAGDYGIDGYSWSIDFPGKDDQSTVCQVVSTADLPWSTTVNQATTSANACDQL